jgi:hypothetical protein
MNEKRTQLEIALEGLSRWDGETKPTWAAAAEMLAPVRTPAHHHRWWNKSVPYAPIAALLLVGVLFVALLLPSLGKARSAARGVAASVRAENLLEQSNSQKTDFASAAPLVPTDRSIIQRSEIEFLSPDVRAAFSRLPGLLSEARGEYIEQSTFSGTGASTAASATLRVPSDRLGTVRAALQGLGRLSSESSSAEDVTEQVVDLDARLRNEQRVEQELLTLLEARRGAPLKEVLEVRESLRSVREQIERLSAQQKRIGRLVSLATIRVSIRAEPAQPAEPAGFWTTASSRIGSTCNDSLKIALDAFTGLLAVVVGGAVWWFLLAVIGFIAWRIWSRRQQLAAFEPPPRL